MKKMAIIGTGVAGMSAAYFLKDNFDITVFEKNDYIGGHTNTVEVFDGEQNCPMDTGFMVFNNKTYPNLVKLFEKLKVPIKNTDMSFSVRNESLDLEYNGSNLDGIFSQRKNIINLKFIKMLVDVLKFNSDAPNMLKNSENQNLSIIEYVKKLGLGNYFFENFLVPMSSAVWSTPMDKMAHFPATSLVRFFHNHGFVGVNTQLQWKTVEGGSREYRKRLIDSFKGNIHLNAQVESIYQDGNKVRIKVNGNEHEFDKVIVASHADETLKMLQNPSELQYQVLSKFSYQKNIATVHTDQKVMPNLKKNWSSWNFMMRGQNAYTVYYMNKLQGVSDKRDFFVNINGEEYVDPNHIIQQITYHHPVFDVEAVKAQQKIDTLNQHEHLNFCGSYYRYGFHEDALLSSVNLCSSILKKDVL
ncbi:FAD-dependent oxidoreductase [Bacteriovoracaceae bacterium]|nr:FAD-dependent oxidoreductase [Bacteriovoracaceae bacterium]